MENKKKDLQKRINEYNITKELLGQYKEDEREQRIALLNELFPSTSSGTINTVEHGFYIKGEFKINTKLIKDFDESAYNSLDNDEADCIIWKPALVMKEYNNLSEIDRVNLDEFVESKLALPTLTINPIEEV